MSEREKSEWRWRLFWAFVIAMVVSGWHVPDMEGGPSPTPTPIRVVTRPPLPARAAALPTRQPVIVPGDAPMSDCPAGYRPEHIWYEKYDEQWWGDHFWAGDTCILKCVATTCNQTGTMGGASNCHVVYVNSWGESKPPWCILE